MGSMTHVALHMLKDVTPHKLRLTPFHDRGCMNSATLYLHIWHVIARRVSQAILRPLHDSAIEIN
jgi:hypothetical protein